MIATKADRLVRSLIDAGLSLTDFTTLAIKAMRIQREFKIDNEDRRQRDRLREQDKFREQYRFEQQLKEEQQRKMKGLEKLRELGYVTGDETYQTTTDYSDQIKPDQLSVSYSKEINNFKQKQRDCCLIFNIDYDLRLNQLGLERACRIAKRNIYELRADRFNRPEHRSILSVATTTPHIKLKEMIRELNKTFLDIQSDQDKKHVQELLTYINQFQADIDLLMCQMQYEPKVKDTVLFSPVTTDILDRMNIILYYVRTLAKRISTGEYNKENLLEDMENNLSDIPSKVAYIVKIKTNDEISSSLSDETNVLIKLYGTYTKSPDIHLIQSINKLKWQSGQIDLFNIELNYLGDIYAIDIWHENQYSSWKVDWIEIIDDAANMYRFPLDRLFNKYSNEKKPRFIIQRDIGPVSRLPTKPFKQIKPYKQIGFTTYTIQVKTGKQPNKATDSLIFLQLKGDNGNFADNLCSANSAFKSSVFEPDQLDTFYLIWPNLAKINSLHLLIQSEGIQPVWFCEYINIEDSQTGDKYKFIVNQLFDGSNPDDPNLKRHLTVYPENTNKIEEKEKPSYLIKLKTGDKGLSDMSTLPSINLILNGDKGKSEPYIFKSPENKRKLFQHNQTDEFLISSKYYVGPIKSLQLSTDEQIDQWFIENIIVRDITQGQDYIFPVYKWMNSQNGTNNLVVQPIDEQKPHYIVYTRTIASELKGPDRGIKLLLQGNKGNHEIELNQPVSMYNSFQPGRKDEFHIKNTKSLGDLQSIEVDVTHQNIKKLGLDYIEIKDLLTNNSYKFNVNRMLDPKNPKMTAKAELIPRSTQNPTSSQTNREQLPLPNTSSSKKNFDHLTTTTPQGAKPPKKNDELPIKSKNSTSSSLNDSEKNSYKIKLKTINKDFRDKNTKLQIELIDDHQQSEMMTLNQTEKNSELLQKGKTDTFTIETTKDLGKLKNIKLSLIDSKSNKKDLYQPDFIEIFHPKSKQTYRIDYTKDDSLNSDQNRLELTKPIKLLSDINLREKSQPQGLPPSFTTINKSTISPYKKLANSILAENNDEDLSSPNSENLSDKLTNNSTRQIRPGDRVKSNSKKQRSIPSVHEADWYRRSIDINEDHPDEAKHIQLISNKHTSQGRFDQQQAYIIKNKRNDENRPNSLPKKSSSRELKQQQFTKTPTGTQQYSNEHRSSLSLQPSTKHEKQISQTKQFNNTDNSAEKMFLIESPTPSNISELTNSIKPSTTTNEQSKTSTTSSKPSEIVSSRRTPPASNTVATNSIPIQSKIDSRTFNPSSNQSMSVTSKSVPPYSRTSNDPPTRRSLSASSNRDNQILFGKTSNSPSTISKDQSQQLINTPSAPPNSAQILPITNPSPTESHLSHSPTNSVQTQSHPTPAASTKTFQKPELTSSIFIDPNSNQYNSQGNTQSISGITIHTIATKSDSDSQLTHESNDSRGSEHSLKNKSLLTPETAKKSRQNRRRERRQSEQTSSSQPSIITPDPSNISPTNNKYLSKETSDIQYTPRSSPNKSHSDNIPLAIERKSPNEKAQTSTNIISRQNQSYTDRPTTPQEIKSRQTTVESRSNDTNKQSQHIMKSSVNTSTTTGHSSVSTTTTQSQNLPNEKSSTEHSTISKNQSISTKTHSNLPIKQIGADHMSTVYEESEPSTVSIPNLPTSPFSEQDYNPDNIPDWLATSSSLSSSQKNSSKEKSSYPSDPHTKLQSIPMKSNLSTDYEFRVQTSNESQLDGTNDPVFIELTNTKGASIEIPLINSMNNSKPFQKGQLDIFHLNIPKTFHTIKKINFFLPKSNQDALHILYCELQDRRTMKTFHFPIEKWLGETNTYNVEMYINDNNNNSVL